MLEGRADIAVHSMKDAGGIPGGPGAGDWRSALARNAAGRLDNGESTRSRRRRPEAPAAGSARQPLSPEHLAGGRPRRGRHECRLDDGGPWGQRLSTIRNGGARARRAGDEHPPRRRLPVPTAACGTEGRERGCGRWLAPGWFTAVRGERRGPAEQAEALGISLAEELDMAPARFSRRFAMEKPAMSISVTRPLPRRSAGQPSAGHGARGLELADRIYARQELRAGRCAWTGARRSACCAIPACGGIRPCPSASRACRLLRAILPGRTTALALHTVSGQHIHYR